MKLKLPVMIMALCWMYGSPGYAEDTTRVFGSWYNAYFDMKNHLLKIKKSGEHLYYYYLPLFNEINTSDGTKWEKRKLIIGFIKTILKPTIKYIILVHSILILRRKV